MWHYQLIHFNSHSRLVTVVTPAAYYCMFGSGMSRNSPRGAFDLTHPHSPGSMLSLMQKNPTQSTPALWCCYISRKLRFYVNYITGIHHLLHGLHISVSCVLLFYIASYAKNTAPHHGRERFLYIKHCYTLKLHKHPIHQITTSHSPNDSCWGKTTLPSCWDAHMQI